MQYIFSLDLFLSLVVSSNKEINLARNFDVFFLVVQGGKRENRG